jgi:Ca2+:H+ antiporter
MIPALSAASETTQVGTARLILELSRSAAIIMLILYLLYLFFQLRSHAHMFPSWEGEEPQDILPFTSGIILIIANVLAALCADYLVESIELVVKSSYMSRSFIGFILLPMFWNADSGRTMIKASLQGKLGLVVSVSLGSSLNIALFVIPFLVILGWIINQNMTLDFNRFEIIVVFVSILAVNYLIRDGKSTYLEGAMCIGM